MPDIVDISKKDFYFPIKEAWIKQSGLSEGDFDREISFAIQHIHKNPYLTQCEPTSVLRAVTNLAQVGLTLNPISKYAYLVPRYNSKSKQLECVLDPDYRGLVKLLTDSKAVLSIECHVVFEGDEFDIDLSDERKVIKHKPAWTVGKKAGKILGAYSIAKLHDGSAHCEPMSYDDICDIKERSESYKAFVDKKVKTCIWLTDEPEMCRKTVIKRHYKYLPKSGNLEQFERAVEIDNENNGFREPIDFGLLTLIESMIHHAGLDDRKKEKFTKQMNSLEYKSEAFKMIDQLKDLQPVPGVDRTAITQYEISKAVKDRADRDDFQERNKK